VGRIPRGVSRVRCVRTRGAARETGPRPWRGVRDGRAPKGVLGGRGGARGGCGGCGARAVGAGALGARGSPGRAAGGARKGAGLLLPPQPLLCRKWTRSWSPRRRSGLSARSQISSAEGRGEAEARGGAGRLRWRRRWSGARRRSWRP
jgi:hypothetical protein